MKAMVLSENTHLELTDLPQPIPAMDELLIEVAACGICGSDVHGYDGSTGRRIPPIVMGHEAAGLVAAEGSSVCRVQGWGSRALRFDRLLRELRLLHERADQPVQ
jgi:D-arabinose 1-dehydrogenase-like Zn-dependent alcohol dehydrogenase